MSRKAYQQKAEARLAEQKAEIDKARAQVKGASADVRLDAEKKLGKLEASFEVAKQRLEDLKEAGEDAWEDIAKGFDDAWDEVSNSVKKLFARSK